MYYPWGRFFQILLLTQRKSKSSYMQFFQLNAALFLLLSLSSVTPIFAQPASLKQEISIWFLEERFLIADHNDDALLETGELRKFPEEFVYYLDERNFEAADKNRDGFLSFNEINARRNSEYIFRYNMERKAYRELARTYPLLELADVRYLKDNPELVVQLFSNFTWMLEHPKLAEEVYSDRSWTARNVEVLVALHKNLRWMASNPIEARDLYRDRNTTQRLPQFLSWRADHQEFMRRFPRLENIDQIDFVPGDIVIGDR